MDDAALANEIMEVLKDAYNGGGPADITYAQLYSELQKRIAARLRLVLGVLVESGVVKELKEHNVTTYRVGSQYGHL